MEKFNDFLNEMESFGVQKDNTTAVKITVKMDDFVEVAKNISNTMKQKAISDWENDRVEEISSRDKNFYIRLFNQGQGVSPQQVYLDQNEKYYLSLAYSESRRP